VGRTNATYRNHLDSFISGFDPFRRALRAENKEFFDRLWEHAHKYASAAAYMNSARPGISAVISILLGHQKQINRLEEKVDSLEKQLENS